jgi:hypothetical protein
VKRATELLDNQQRASRDDAKKNIFFLMVFSTNKTDRYIVERGVKHHKPSSLAT